MNNFNLCSTHALSIGATKCDENYKQQVVSFYFTIKQYKKLKEKGKITVQRNGQKCIIKMQTKI